MFTLVFWVDIHIDTMNFPSCSNWKNLEQSYYMAVTRILKSLKTVTNCSETSGVVPQMKDKRQNNCAKVCKGFSHQSGTRLFPSHF